MLQYRRRNETEVSTASYVEESPTPLLTYCNWSYAPDYHIDLRTLQNILRSFNEEYIPYYLRIFNETPRQVVEAFLEQYEISKGSLEAIYSSLAENKIIIRKSL